MRVIRKLLRRSSTKWILAAAGVIFGLKLWNALKRLVGESDKPWVRDLLDNALDNSQGQTSGFATEAGVIAENLYATLNTIWPVGLDAVKDVLEPLTYEEGAAVVAAFGERPFNAIGFTAWQGTLVEFIHFQDSFFGTTAAEVIAATEYLSGQ